MSLNKSTKAKPSLTVQQKIEIVEKLESGVAPVTLANEYNTSLVTLRRIRRDAKSLHHYADQGNHVLKRKNRRKPIYADVETRVYQWYLERKAGGDKLTDSLLQQKALEISNKSGPSKFNASRGWVTKFKARHNIRSLRIYGEETSAEEETMERLVADSTETMEKQATKCYNSDGANETIVTWEAVPSKRLNVPGFEPPVLQPIEFIALPKLEEVDIPMEEQEKEQIQVKQEKEEQEEDQEEEQNQRLGQGDIKQEKEELEETAEDIKKKELEEALKTLEKYATNKTMLKIARSLISDLLEEDT